MEEKIWRPGRTQNPATRDERRVQKRNMPNWVVRSIERVKRKFARLKEIISYTERYANAFIP
ncbi:MAG: hypothetical protein ACREHV_03820 [Rhizomicrobium sp.]